MIKYGRVTLAERCQIMAYLQVDMSFSDIARELGRNKSTISREIKRNSTNYLYSREYRASPAHQHAKKRFESCRRKEVLVGELKSYVCGKLACGWSPDEIAGRYRLESFKSLSHETIYSFVRKNHDFKKYLRWTRNRGASRYKQRAARVEKYASIHDRPQIANERRRIGDWERDGMYGANRQQLLVCTDRKTRYTKLARMPKKAEAVGELTINLLKSTGKRLFTVTNDNGSEFRGTPPLGAKFYYCDPMKPQQRGTVEHTIGMLRRYITRQTDLMALNDEQIREVANKLNLRPRKILGYMTSHEMFFKTKVALAI